MSLDLCRSALMVRSGRALGALLVLAAGVAVGVPTGPAAAQEGEKKKEEKFPPFAKVSEGMTKVVSTADGSAGLWDLYTEKESGRMLAALPRDAEGKLFMIACTVSAGDPEAGVMGPTHYVQWERYDTQMALVAPNLGVRTDGGPEAQASIEELFTGRVLLSVPIVSQTADGRVVVDLRSIAVEQAGKLFGGSVWEGYGPSMMGLDPRLAKLTKAKAFPQNVVVEYQAPRGDGQIVRLTYSIGSVDGTPGFKGRKADNRVGYFYDSFEDYARASDQEIAERLITRWNIEKADAKLAKSPPKQPIVWYIEQTTPVKYRMYVRNGILAWNEAFEKIGIVGALEVYQQDAATGAHMDKDPEDARYNFFRWNTSDEGYAIGPSRTNPRTGEILDADVVWHQGLTRGIRSSFEIMSDDWVEQTFSPETLAWFDENPQYDPRVRLAPPERRKAVEMARLARVAAAGVEEMGTPEHPWTKNACDHTNRACRIGNQLALDFSLADAALAAGVLAAEGEKKDDVELLDGLPEAMVGQMIRYISAHEVGHCLGLQHNMAASTIRTLKEVNSPGFEGPTVGSVMDYVAVNINHNLGEVQGPYASPQVGPYDHWAIAYGYGPEDKLEEVLARTSEPDHVYVSQIAMSVGSDPRNMTWDFGANNLEFAQNRLELTQHLRGKLLSDIVDDGESWALARRRYEALLGTHVQSLFIASNWIGGSFTNNDEKGDPGDRKPIEDVPAASQREALNLIVDNAFKDEAFGLTPELVRHLGKEYWWDARGIDELMADPAYNVHDLVGGIQATGLSLVMNPSRLRRVYDNEFRTQDAKDVFTAAELVTTVTDSVWGEVFKPGKGATSSFRRNLQREHAERLIALSLPRDTMSPSMRAVASLARAELGRIRTGIEGATGKSGDAMTDANLTDIKTRIDRALDAAYVVTR